MNWDRLPEIENALKTVTDAVYHFSASGADAPYIVWAEDGAIAGVSADNRPVNRALTGTVDYFTHNTTDPTVAAIEAALETVETLAWRLESVQYEDDTQLCHYEWVWEFG